MTSKQKYNVAVVAAALQLIESPGMTVGKLRTLREFEIYNGIKDDVDQMYYDSILAAIEMMERPLFQ